MNSPGWRCQSPPNPCRLPRRVVIASGIERLYHLIGPVEEWQAEDGGKVLTVQRCLRCDHILRVLTPDRKAFPLGHAVHGIERCPGAVGLPEPLLYDEN